MRMKVLFLSFLVNLVLLVPESAGAVFSLSDSNPNSAQFKRRFLASYGVNEAIEPKLTSKERPLYEKVAPLLANSPRQAIDLVRQSVTSNSNAAFDFLLGNLHYQLRDYSAAEMALQNAVRKFPAFRRAYRTLALSQVQRTRYDDAVAPLLKVIELGGGDAQAYGLLAYCYLVAEKYESGLSAYRMARMFEPDSLDFRRGQAHCLMQTQQHALAIALFEELIEEYPSEIDFWLLQANAFIETGRRDQAIANLQLLADSEQGTWQSFVLLGDLYLGEDLVTLANEAYLQGLHLQPAVHGDSLVRPLEALLARRLFDASKQYLEALGKISPASLSEKSRSLISLASAKVELAIGDAEGAVTSLKAILDSEPLNGEVLLTLGEHFFGKTDYDQAERYFDLARSVSEVEVDALIGLGRVSVARRTFAIAVDFLRRAQSIESRDNVARYLEAVEQRSRRR